MFDCADVLIAIVQLILAVHMHILSVFLCVLQCIECDSEYGPLAENLKQYPESICNYLFLLIDPSCVDIPCRAGY